MVKHNKIQQAQVKQLLNGLSPTERFDWFLQNLTLINKPLGPSTKLYVPHVGGGYRLRTLTAYEMSAYLISLTPIIGVKKAQQILKFKDEDPFLTNLIYDEAKKEKEYTKIAAKIYSDPKNVTDEKMKMLEEFVDMNDTTPATDMVLHLQKIIEEIPEKIVEIFIDSGLTDASILDTIYDEMSKQVPIGYDPEEMSDTFKELISKKKSQDINKDMGRTKTAVKTIAGYVAAGAAPGAITGNPAGAAVGAGMGVIVGVGTAIKDIVVDSMTTPQVVQLETESQTSLPTQSEACKVVESAVNLMSDPIEVPSGDTRDDTDLQAQLDQVDEHIPELDLVDVGSMHGSETVSKRTPSEYEPFSEDATINQELESLISVPPEQTVAAEVNTRGVREGYYKNAVHPDAIGLYFGSSTNPNWNNTLFFDRSTLSMEEISANKAYYYKQSLLIVDKYGVDIFIYSLKYTLASSAEDIIKENHEVLQLFFKLKNIVPVPTEPTFEMFAKILKEQEPKQQSFEESVDEKDYESGNGVPMENDKYNPFRQLSNTFNIDPKDSYEMRLMGDAIPIEDRQTFRGEPQYLSNIIVKDLKKSLLKGALPDTKVKAVVSTFIGTKIPLASEEELCRDIFKF